MITVLGISHKTAPLSVRERFSASGQSLAELLAGLQAQAGVEEAVLLTTCNRTELYYVVNQPLQSAAVVDWFIQRAGLPLAEAEGVLYQHEARAALMHLMRVSCGLDSMVLGEAEILGQVKHAFSEACLAGAVGSVLSRIFQSTFKVAKEIRTISKIGLCPVSVASVSVKVLESAGVDLSQAKILLLGAGQVNTLVAKYLNAKGARVVSVASRQLKTAEALAQSYAWQTMSLTQALACFNQFDVIITALAAQQPLVTVEHVTAKNSGKLHVIDIAVPRNVAVDVAECEQVILKSIDDLREISALYLQAKRHAAEQAEKLVEREASYLLRQLNGLEANEVISAYRRKIEEFKQLELERALALLKRGENPQQVVEILAHGLSNKIMHAPSTQLRQASSEGRFDVIQLAQELLAIDEIKTN